ncbi:MAG: pyridoxamine 5'-phosphate oxidase family protein [Nitrospirae bacterium]|nr:pyridoxamine 5'-phosphate oxidase family protein [Candidatus Manganitrophaceae bacterium]
MGKHFKVINDNLKHFIEAQPMFFVATAGATGCVNLSPKGMDSFRILTEKRVVWLNLTGSGNETAAHLLENSRMTIMFCAFDEKPLILRLYGQAKIHHPRDQAWADLISVFPEIPGARQIIEMEIDSVGTSCGWAVPFMAFQEERTQLEEWAVKQGEAGVEQYWKDKNQLSIDNKPTGILESS